MDPSRLYVASEFAPIVTFLDAVLSELNAGLLIHHLENSEDAGTLKLIYANREASRSTGLDMQPRLGKLILDAFPPLAETDLPELFRQVVNSGESQRIEVPYGEEKEAEANYFVRAFPMPSHCVGVLFEREES